MVSININLRLIHSIDTVGTAPNNLFHEQTVEHPHMQTPSVPLTQIRPLWLKGMSRTLWPSGHGGGQTVQTPLAKLIYCYRNTLEEIDELRLEIDMIEGTDSAKKWWEEGYSAATQIEMAAIFQTGGGGTLATKAVSFSDQ